MALTDGAVPLAVGTTLALGALTLVLWPLLASDTPPMAEVNAGDIRVAAARKAQRDFDAAIDALRDTDVDHAAGKLTDADWAGLRRHDLQRAVHAMRQGDGLALAAAVGITDADIEETIRRAGFGTPACRDCGPRPEPDAVYCSNCGRYLPGSCPACNSEVRMPASRYCDTCGLQLAPV